MTVLDAYAALAVLQDEPAAPWVDDLLRSGARLTVIGACEVLDQLIRVHGVDEDNAVLDLAELGLLDPIAIDTTIGVQAGLLRARHYHRTRRPVSLADCVAAEAARSTGAALATADAALLDVCHEESIAVTPLPDTSGSVWAPPPGD